MGIMEVAILISTLIRASRDIMINVSEITDLFETMNAEGRATLTEAEEAALVALRDEARAALAAAIRDSP